MSLVLNPTLKQNPTPSLRVNWFCLFQLHLLASHSITEAHLLPFMYNICVDSPSWVTFQFITVFQFGGRLGNIFWRMHSPKYLLSFFLSFFFFFNRVVSPLRRKTVLCDVAPPMWRC